MTEKFNVNTETGVPKKALENYVVKTCMCMTTYKTNMCKYFA